MFRLLNLSIIAYAGGFTFWIYKDQNIEIEEMIKDDFFKDAKGIINEKDLIICAAKDTVETYYIKTTSPKITLKKQGE